jgi:hypothetical protein
LLGPSCVFSFNESGVGVYAMGAGASSSKSDNRRNFPKDQPPGKYANLTLDSFETSDTQFRLLSQIKNKGYLEARRSPKALDKKTHPSS